MIASKLFTVRFKPDFEGVTQWTVPADNAMHAVAICSELGEEMAEAIGARFEIESVNPERGQHGEALWIRIPDREPEKIETLPSQPQAHSSPIQVPQSIQTVSHEGEE